MTIIIKKVETPDAPAALGPYSQAVAAQAAGSLIFVSGQLPIDPATGQLVEGDIKALTRQVIKNIENILSASGSRLSDVVRTDVFLTDLKKDFSGMNEEYSKHFSGPVPPARQTIQPSALPMGSSIEISCIAISR